jgi:hypothetical protein
LHGQFVWPLALQALFFVCFHVNQNQAATYDHEKPTMQTHTHTSICVLIYIYIYLYTSSVSRGPRSTAENAGGRRPT